MASEIGCSICEDPSTKDNPIVTCADCSVKVHVYCYGIDGHYVNWKCSPCQSGATKFSKCQLCMQKKGAMKKTNCDEYVHVICALFTDGVIFLDQHAMEPVDVSKVSKSKLNKLCSFCYNSQGYCSLCANKKCENRLHVTCAQKNKALKEVVSDDDTIKFYAYCNNHKPKESSSRLSSDSVKNVVDKKQSKQLKKRADSENAAWLLYQIEYHSTPQKKTLEELSEYENIKRIKKFS